MNDDFEQEDVIDLAERIFIKNVSFENTHATLTREARHSIQAAMVFREIQREIFCEKD